MTRLLPLFLILAMSSSSTRGIDHLRVAYQWKLMDYEWPNDKTKNLFPEYRQEDNLPLGLEVAGDRVFVTVPRWRRGVVSTLNYININDSRPSPPLTPFPSWEAHQFSGSVLPEIISTFRVRADRCNRLWVLDTGLVDILGSPEQQVPPSLLVYDLSNDQLLRRYPVPEDQRTVDSLFANIAVEDYKCDDAYAYLGDLGGPGLVVYSWRLARSWLVKHHYFHPDPQAGEFNVGGVVFHWNDGIFGMALKPQGKTGFSTLYFHPLTSTMEFAVDTRLLRDPERLVSSESFHQFQVLGSRGTNGQSSVSFLDPRTNILFYALTNLNAIACWHTESRYNLQSQGRVYMDNITMVFPNDIKIDQNGKIWVLSDRLPTFMYHSLDPEDYNFRILTGTVPEAVQGTVCSRGLVSTSTTTPKPDVAFRNFKPKSKPSKPKASTASSNLEVKPGLILGLMAIKHILGKRTVWQT